MPLQNRVTPLGELVADPARGLVYGNRGCLHDDEGRIRRRYNGRRWIACRLEFRGWQRSPLLQPGRFTELFFLDEATAFAAGHRPCFFCRRDDANRFRAAWEEGNGVSGVRAREIDAVLHGERLDRRKKRLHPLPVPVAQLPDGAMVQRGEESFLIVRGSALRWSLAGYSETVTAIDNALLLTPPSTLRALSVGYRPALHPSAAESKA
jgi:hypothetical protein